MSEEKRQILEMLKEGKISTDEAMKLLEAVDVKDEPIQTKTDVDQLKNHFLRIRVKDGDDLVNVNIPLSLMTAGLKIAEKFDTRLKDIDALKEIDFNEILEIVKNGGQGKLVEVKNDKDDEIVEIFVD